jgi:hypothetical protein
MLGFARLTGPADFDLRIVNVLYHPTEIAHVKPSLYDLVSEHNAVGVVGENGSD